jgi:triacylglycerol esterase/lipase EstA (alpha/beta hydrolase family)
MDKEMVVLLHGMARTSRSMAGMARHLEREGFAVLNVDYKSRRKTLDDLAREVRETLSRSFEAAAAPRLHFVTHSMGGLVARRLIQQDRPANLGRVVMLGTPHRGSEIADFLKGWPLYKKFYGPAGQELTTDHQARKFPDRDIDFELGAIAGTAAFLSPVSGLLLPRPNDGTVSVESTKLPGMKAHLALPVTHTFMMDNSAVQRQTAAFLKAGKFAP